MGTFPVYEKRWCSKLDGYELDTQGHRGIDELGDVVGLSFVVTAGASMQLEIRVAMLVAE